ncbi:hypothetical protein [Citreimonas salinaria]|nr:hypothetical protein [Citreimonas salinaria]
MPEAEGTPVEHRLDLLLDRLDQLEFTVSRLFDTDTDGHEDDRLAQIEARLHALQEQIGLLADHRRATTALDTRLDAMQDSLASLTVDDAAIDALAQDMGSRHDALLDTLSSLATTDEAKTSLLAQSAEEQQRQLDALHAMIAALAERPAEGQQSHAGDATILMAIEELADRQRAAQAQMTARFAALENGLADDAYAALSFRVSRLVDARMAAGFANLADVVERAVETIGLAVQGAPKPIDPRSHDAGDAASPIGERLHAAIDEATRACRNSAVRPDGTD